MGKEKENKIEKAQEILREKKVATVPKEKKEKAPKVEFKEIGFNDLKPNMKLRVFSEREQKHKQVAVVHIDGNIARAVNLANGIIWDLPRTMIEAKELKIEHKGETVPDAKTHYTKSSVEKHLRKFSQDRPAYVSLMKHLGIVIAEEKPKEAKAEVAASMGV